MEISSKSMGGKSICEFPDVCFTPPQTPATPPGVPIPYPNTGMASDTTDGSRTVQIGGEEVMLKDRSSFKQSTGDEAGCAPKKGIITSTTKGAVYFTGWSMDVKIEGENVVRNLDLTTHNHGSKKTTGAAPTVQVAKAAKAAPKPKKDPCAHKSNKKKRVYVIYAAPDRDNPGKTYVGRTRGRPGQLDRTILAKRKSTHHRNLGKMRIICRTTSYAASRGAEQLHYEATPRKAPQDQPLSERHERKDDYRACAKLMNPNCAVCGA
jgi:hypothetical protein